jgi:hypothetical protein
LLLRADLTLSLVLLGTLGFVPERGLVLAHITRISFFLGLVRLGLGFQADKDFSRVDERFVGVRPKVLDFLSLFKL